MKHPPFSVKAHKFGCENSKFIVILDTLAEDGKTLVSDYLVVIPKAVTVDGITGVAVLPVIKDKIGLVQVYRHAVAQNSWEVPRGFIEKDETSLLAASRELEEETGLHCSTSLLHDLGIIMPEPGIIAARVQLYQANISEMGSEIQNRELGHSDFKWFSSSEIEKLLKDDLLLDATTLIACHRAGIM
jgi:ADP-ribose pyrophosphatase